MRARPFILENIRIDRQRRERIWSLLSVTRPYFAFHSEHAGSLHFREIGENVVCAPRAVSHPTAVRYF